MCLFTASPWARRSYMLFLLLPKNSICKYNQFPLGCHSNHTTDSQLRRLEIKNAPYSPSHYLRNCRLSQP